MPEVAKEGMIVRVLDWAYVKAINGGPGLDSAADLANHYLKGRGNQTERVNRLIRWQSTKAATSGFVFGLGGIITIPVTLPLNITSVVYVQLRMISAIALMGDHDVRDDRVKTLAIACLAGNGIADILKDVGIGLGTKLAKNVVSSISGKTITAINKKVGVRLVTKFGQSGAVNLGKLVPLLGGIIGGAVDATTTNLIGNVARKAFIEGVYYDVKAYRASTSPESVGVGINEGKV